MASQIGKLKPKFSLLLNPHAQTRLSKCPHCGKATYPRKFALLMGVEGWGLFVQGKTCKFCSKCAMVIVQQDDLEIELAYSSGRVAGIAGQKYVLVGVVDGKQFKEALRSPGSLDETLAHTSDFKIQYGLGLRPGGWFKEGQKPPVLPGAREQIIPGPSTPTRTSTTRPA